jgi:hypothetical protein
MYIVTDLTCAVPIQTQRLYIVNTTCEFFPFYVSVVSVSVVDTGMCL